MSFPYKILYSLACSGGIFSCLMLLFGFLFRPITEKAYQLRKIEEKIKRKREIREDFYKNKGKAEKIGEAEGKNQIKKSERNLVLEKRTIKGRSDGNRIFSYFDLLFGCFCAWNKWNWNLSKSSAKHQLYLAMLEDSMEDPVYLLVKFQNLELRAEAISLYLGEKGSVPEERGKTNINSELVQEEEKNEIY